MDSYTPEDTADGSRDAADTYSTAPGTDQPRRAAGIDTAEWAEGHLVRQPNRCVCTGSTTRLP